MSRSVWFLALALMAGPAAAAEPNAGDLEFFEKKIRPLLANSCFQCHSGAKVKGGLRLDSGVSVLKGGDSGAAVVPGHPEKSLLLDVVSYAKDVQMPPKGKLPETAITDLSTWVKRGAIWPQTVAGEPTLRTSEVISAEDRAFWSFRPISDPAPPAVKNGDWIQKPLDRFILARLEEKGMSPVATASKRVLIRRATFDLLGLPPTVAEVDAFLADDSPDALRRVIDRLLSSPHYGERWGRYWLDVARYGEDQAHTFQARLYPGGFRYRDWVVKSFQDDMPFDRFIIEQIAGDLLTDGDRVAHAAALGYFALGPVYYADAGEARAAEAAELDDRIDTLGRGFLGLTIACARCHDHKFDPIPTRDYYSLAGIFRSSKYVEVLLASPEVIDKFNAGQKRVKDQEEKIKKHLEAEAARQTEKLVAETARYLLAAWKLNHERKTNPKFPTSFVSFPQGLQDDILERWQKYLFGNGSENRPHLAEWRKATARLDRVHDLGSLIAALAHAKATAESFQAEIQKAQNETRSGGKAEWVKEVMGFYRLTGRQAERRLDAMGRKLLATMRSELETIKKTAPPKPPTVHSLTEGQAEDMRIYHRGNYRKEGDVAPRRFLRILAGDAPPLFSQGSGRLELARAIASPDNPLTARVLVNRLWQHHFGKGLVTTPSNFGKLGQKPTHPELLDHLARRFMANGWSIKAMHREIMLSASYQLGSAWNDANAQIDGNNDLHWRMNRRRLDVEAWRDTLLAVAGALDPSVGGPSQDLSAAHNRRRTLYGKISRHNLDYLLRLFDFPDPNITSEDRPTTIGPVQQLFVLNSPFMADQAKGLARLLAGENDDSARVRTAYLRLYGRPPTDREVRIGLDFLAAPPVLGEPTPTLNRWEQYAQVLLSANELTFVD